MALLFFPSSSSCCSWSISCCFCWCCCLVGWRYKWKWEIRCKIIYWAAASLYVALPKNNRRYEKKESRALWKQQRAATRMYALMFRLILYARDKLRKLVAYFVRSKSKNEQKDSNIMNVDGWWWFNVGHWSDDNVLNNLPEHLNQFPNRNEWCVHQTGRRPFQVEAIKIDL